MIIEFRVVNIATSKNLTDKSTMFPLCNIPKFTCPSPHGKTYNQFDHTVQTGDSISSVLDVLSFRGLECDTDHYLLMAKFRERATVHKQTSTNFTQRGSISRN
jgi:DNA-directed RNA polymerase subunit N (RpoN/RPB10)